MIKIKAAHVYKIRAHNSRAIAKPAFVILGNAEIDHFGFKSLVHVLSEVPYLLVTNGVELTSTSICIRHYGARNRRLLDETCIRLVRPNPGN